MERFDRLRILFLVLALLGLGPLPCRAQPDLPSPRPAQSSPLLQLPVQLNLPPQPSQKSPLELPPPPGGEIVTLPLPPLEPGDLRFPINLATALRLADARPLIVAAAQASAWVAEAKLQKAATLWVPSFMIATSYARHDGPIDFNGGVDVPQGINSLGQPSPGSFGKPLNQNLNWFIAGVSLYQVVATTDIIFQPLAQRQDLNAKRWDIQTAKNDALLEIARAYFNVHRFRGQYAGALYTVQEGRKVIAAIEALSRDLVPAVEVDRARNLLAFLEQQAVLHRQNWRIASADLTQVLRLDPRAVVEPLEPDHLQITMIEPDRSLDDLMQIALTNRPELASRQALVQAALVRIRQEKLRPILPIPMVNGFQTPYEQIQVGAFGIGNGGKMNLWYARDDVAPGLAWQFANLGLGNAAMVKWRRGEASQATVELFRIQDMVVADVTRSQALLQSAAARVVQAERELRGALVNYKGVVEGLKQTQRFGNVLKLVFRVPDAVFSLQLLKMAYDDYWTTVAEYNQAQFRLFHALGYPAREVAYFRRTGEILPVNTMRPGFLPPVGTGPPPPPVGTGPPPATR